MSEDIYHSEQTHREHNNIGISCQWVWPQQIACGSPAHPIPIAWHRDEVGPVSLHICPPPATAAPYICALQDSL